MDFKVGDCVIVYRKYMKADSSFIWISPDMDKCIGKEGVINKVPRSKSCITYEIKFTDPTIKCIYWFPEESLALNDEDAKRKSAAEQIRMADNLKKLNAYKPVDEIKKFMVQANTNILRKYKLLLSNSPEEYLFAANDKEAIRISVIKYKAKVNQIWSESSTIGSLEHWLKIYPLVEKKEV